MDIDFSSVIDMKLAIILWFIGFAIKHVQWKPIKQLSNKLIPVLLIIIGIGAECLFVGDVTFDGMLVGGITAMFAVGVHSSGNNLWKAFLKNSNSSLIVTDDDNLIGTDDSYIEEPDSSIETGNNSVG